MSSVPFKNHIETIIRHRRVRQWIWLALFAFLISAFFIFTSEVREAAAGEIETIHMIDQMALQWLISSRVPVINNISIDITALGSAAVLTLLVGFVILFSYFYKKYVVITHLLIASLGSIILTKALKAHFERARPEEAMRLVEVQGFSYPSGHSLSSAAIYFTLAIVLGSMLKNYWHRFILLCAISFLIALIGLSRMYLGVHYFSDVCAGVLMGIAWASLLAAFFSNIKKSDY